MSDCICGARGIDLDGHECVPRLWLHVIELQRELEQAKERLGVLARLVVQLESQLSEAKERERQLLNALANLVAKIKILEPPIDAEFVFGHIHGRVYGGPNWIEEMKEAEAALTVPPAKRITNRPAEMSAAALESGAEFEIIDDVPPAKEKS